jgi:hypothetical protein
MRLGSVFENVRTETMIVSAIKGSKRRNKTPFNELLRRKRKSLS